MRDLGDTHKLELHAANCASELRRKWGISDNDVIDIRSLVKAKDFLLLCFPNESGISGMYIEKKDREGNVRCIYINTHEPLGRQNFSIAHELYHAFYEKGSSAACMQKSRSKDPVEKKAEIFASNFLMPRNLLIEQIKKKRKTKYNINDIFDIQKYFGVSFQAVVYAIKDLIQNNVIDIPQNITSFFSYFRSHWDELAKMTLTYDKENLLNSCNPVYEFPEEFKENLLLNYKRGKIDLEHTKEIFSFFDTEFNG